jgi:hypothetical protein
MYGSVPPPNQSPVGSATVTTIPGGIAGRNSRFQGSSPMKEAPSVAAAGRGYQSTYKKRDYFDDDGDDDTTGSTSMSGKSTGKCDDDDEVDPLEAFM